MRVDRKEEKVREKKVFFGKKINRAIRVAYKRVEDPIQGRSPEKPFPEPL